MGRCEYINEYGERCNRTFRTGRKYCYEHRHSPHPTGGGVVERATREYIRFHTNRTFGCLISICIFLLILFLYIGYSINQCLTLMAIGPPISFIISLFICIKYLKVKFNPRKDVEQKTPEFVDWVQKRVNKVKEGREFNKNLWR